jgi:hypothetical protein
VAKKPDIEIDLNQLTLELNPLIPIFLELL